MRLLRRAGAECRQDGIGQLFAEFDAKLIKGIDAPKRAEHRDLVFIKRHQLAKLSLIHI